MLNTQWKDYVDPYMWCCGCIPPVRLNPICYRFGLKKRRCSKHKRVGGGCIHASQYIPLLLYHEGSELNLPLKAVFFYLCVLGCFKKKKRILAYMSRLYTILFFFSEFLLFFFNNFYFPFVVGSNPNPPPVSS